MLLHIQTMTVKTKLFKNFAVVVVVVVFTLRYLPSPKAVIAVLNIQADKEGNIKLKQCANDPILDIHVFRSFSTICQISPKQFFLLLCNFRCGDRVLQSRKPLLH